jgi:vitamin K-dependent gamma-carboxylase-like protein
VERPGARLVTTPDASGISRSAPRRWLAALLRYQHDAWFAPADPRALAICRVVLFGDVCWSLSQDDLTAYADFAPTAWYPVSFFRAWSVPLLGAEGLKGLCLVATLATLAAMLGIAYRVSAPIGALAMLYQRGVPQNFGKVNHSQNLLIVAVFVFACARAADVWSFDAWVGRRWARQPPPAPNGCYRWPLRFISLTIVTMYGAAGLRKLLRSGLHWALGDSFRLLLLRHHFTHSPPTRIGVWIADSRWCKALALSALALETSSPLAMLSRRVYRVIVPSLFVLQASIWLTLGVYFRPMLPLFVCLLPWAEALVWLEGAKRWFAPRLARALSSPAR